ncbi:MAG: hypothetical protein RID42_08625 [Alphaproteobacteria bacterium]|jgi:hypothetical protein
MDEDGPYITWRIAVALIVAGIGTFAVGVGGWVWFSVSALPTVSAAGLSILIIPGTVLFILLLGFLWYHMFNLMLTVLRADEHDS